ncbi:MAG: hypothetical protein JOY69_01285 [Candidatus Eremiobacteraeota bacterium]|nr:hypothetical protein [Candidatus Eremiobacteraeota bacterium]
MSSRFAISWVAAGFAALTGCSGGAYSKVAPSGDMPAQRLSNATVNETVLHRFMGGAMDGSTPISGLAKGGNLLYGTSADGGAYNKGTIFSIASDGSKFTVLYSFKGGADGHGSEAGLINVGGTFYGTTEVGGTNDKGTVFAITPAGAFRTLYSFKGGSGDGAKPMTALTNVRGTLYGTTASGGSAGGFTNSGTVFSISTTGQEKIRYFFRSNKDDGAQPMSQLVYVGGKLYGTTALGGVGGAFGNGTIFSVTTSGNETVLYRFKDDFDGNCNFNCFLTNLDGTLYGTAHNGGKNRLGSIFSITTAGAFKTLYNASLKGAAGGQPSAALTPVAGMVYGTMSVGPVGTNNGTVFSVTTGGALTVLYSFGGGSDGANPSARLSLVGRELFGTTAHGGGKNAGTIYSIAGF